MTTTTTTAYAPTVGDIFASSWGYDQTNVDFYEVTKVTASQKSVYVKKVGQRLVRDDGSYTTVVPVPGDYATREERVYSDTGSKVDPNGNWNTETRSWEPRFYDSEYVELDAERKLVQFSGVDQTPYLKMASYAYAYLWDGTPKYQTGWGFGH